ncbi:hypothetical protein AB0L34_09480 [Micromonospora sp. NPDC052213]
MSVSPNTAPVQHLSAEVRRWSDVGTVGRLLPGPVDATAPARTKVR